MAQRSSAGPEPAGWLLVVAAVVVLPFRLAWELVVAIERVVENYLVVPLLRLVSGVLRWLGRVLVLVVWRPLVLVWQRLVRDPLVWLLRLVWTYLLGPLVHGLTLVVEAIGRAVRWLLTPLARALCAILEITDVILTWLFRNLVLPVLRGLALLGRLLVVTPLRWIWRYLLRPVLRAVALVWTVGVAPLLRGLGRLVRLVIVTPARWAWRTLVVAPSTWVRLRVLDPLRQAARDVLRQLGLGTGDATAARTHHRTDGR